MRITRVVVCLVVLVSQVIIPTPTSRAASLGGIVISQMYPGATGNATQEFVEIHNNSDVAIDITGWCIQYVSSSGKTTKKLGCFTAPDAATTLWLAAEGNALFVSEDMKEAVSVKTDGYFSTNISATHGYIQIVDASDNIIDMLGWGDDLSDTTYPASQAPDNGMALWRKKVGTQLQDTDNDAHDFVSDDPLVSESDVYEQVSIVDKCPNLTDTTEIPEGYLQDHDGNCYPDSCVNIDGLQITVPVGYDRDTDGVCTQHDECDNLPDIQSTIPDSMVRGSDRDCVIDHSPLVLTEILPNAFGRDIGNEFIEIYNSGSETVDLTHYFVKIGDSDEVYSFPVGSLIGPGEYRSFSDSEMKFTLLNSSSRVVLMAIGGMAFGDTGIYQSPKDGESWAYIAESWQYTNRPTPGAENLASIMVTDEGDDSSLTPCDADQYRNPETGRCKKYATASSLKPCKKNQYRNPETNRCRKISTKTLKPCKEGQYRNPETNRCKSVLGASTLKPCRDGQYRSEETNRCRNLPASSVPEAAFAVQPVKDTGMAFVGWWTLGGVVLLAISYAAWEWRRELATVMQKIIRRIQSKR